MPNQLARRKYQELVRFLKKVMTNESAPMRLRMTAAERLDGIFQRAEERESKALDRAYRAELRKLEAEAAREAARASALAVGDTAPGPTDEDRIKAVWSTMQGRRADVD